jgi:hypothetical protein
MIKITFPNLTTKEIDLALVSPDNSSRKVLTEMRDEIIGNGLPYFSSLDFVVVNQTCDVLEDLGQAMYDPNLKLSFMHKEQMLVGQNLMKSNPQFNCDQFLEECKNGKYSGRDVVKQEPGVPAKKVDMTKKYNFDENSAQNQEAFKKRILNPEKTDSDPKKTRWVADGFTNAAKENLPML